MPFILNPGIVLSRRDFGESGRLSVVYTKDLGKIWVKFSGVNGAGRKMKAFSEPFAHCEYRFHATHGAGYVKATGGSLLSSFPGIRKNLDSLSEAFLCCELLSALTVFGLPGPEKYELLKDALSFLDAQEPSQLMIAAFGLRLLELAGFGVREKSPFQNEISPSMWEALYRYSFAELSRLPFDLSLNAQIRRLVEEKIEEESHRVLKTPIFIKSMLASKALEECVPL